MIGEESNGDTGAPTSDTRLRGLAWKDLGLSIEPAEGAQATTDMGHEAWRLYGRTVEAGLGALDSSGRPRLPEPPGGPTGPSWKARAS